MHEKDLHAVEELLQRTFVQTFRLQYLVDCMPDIVKKGYSVCDLVTDSCEGRLYWSAISKIYVALVIPLFQNVCAEREESV